MQKPLEIVMPQDLQVEETVMQLPIELERLVTQELQGQEHQMMREQLDLAELLIEMIMLVDHNKERPHSRNLKLQKEIQVQSPKCVQRLEILLNLKLHKGQVQNVKHKV